ncbi:response regulator transcription factor [Arthrobacter sp. zg-Y1143]|uniref:response regulator transcription factor n=1 Tax=Arthrobacter sp. zg-Y1143 TaxID=3049065 RepID=UPI0024C38F68|nr:response regulator transcription factor [Arthrobacter sp. zg-Y1143]MDK1326433.1 response regulator transcription factor [Arthrobacter sp. zg-Y1143]
MRIALAEDSALLRAGLTELLTSRGHEVGIAVDNAADLLAALDGVDDDALPDVVVLDNRMPPTFTNEGIRAALSLRGSHPRIGVLVLSQYVETRYAAELLAGSPAGVGYLLKDRVADVRDFLDALARLARGETVLDPEVVQQLVGASRHRSDLDRLTAREREVLELMAQGRTNTAVGSTLFLSAGAVEKNITSIFAKLGLQQSPADHRRVLAVLAYLQSA